MTIVAELSMLSLKYVLFFVFGIANIVFFAGNLEGLQSLLYRGCLVNTSVVLKYIGDYSAQFSLAL